VLHYYFTDKVDLITHCVRQYKAQCVHRYDQIVATADSPEVLATGFLAKLRETLVDDALMHRLWYDLRNQSLFEESFRADVLEIDRRREEMIDHVVARYAELASVPAGVPRAVAYALFDGLFQQALLRHLAGDEEAAAELERAVPAVLARVVVA